MAIGELMAPINLVAVLRIALSRPTGERPDGKIGRALDRLDEVLYAGDRGTPRRGRPGRAQGHPVAVAAGAR